MTNRLSNNQFPDFLSVAEKLSTKLANGHTHFISRKKLRASNGYYYNDVDEVHFFQTFHSLAAKILPKHTVHNNSIGLPKTGSLSGEDMYASVKNAVKKYDTAHDLKDSDINVYYKAIRLYENGRKDSLAELEAGHQIFESYQDIMAKKLDWEDSISLAIYYLDRDIITNVEGLPKRYIILDPEALLEDRNKNVAHFMISFYRWTFRNGYMINFLFLKNNKQVVPYINGSKLNELSVDEILNLGN